MLSNVSWGGFWGTLVILLVVYYGYIGLKYYREDIMALIKGRFPKAEKDQASNGEPVIDLSNTSSLEELEAVVNDIRYAVLEKAGMNAVKPDLLLQVKQRLANYEGLQRPAFRVAINNYIITHAKEICGVVFSESELEAAWEALLR